jgi:phenylalanyl-tRNA synthetase alpha chain
MMNEDLTSEVAQARERLLKQLEQLTDKPAVLRSPDLRALYQRIATLPEDQRGLFGQAVNQLKNELEGLITEHQEAESALPPVDVSAPFALNSEPSRRPGLLSAAMGSRHPISRELELILDIFNGMGFSVVESREIDDDWHMFGALNFPEGHPARDDYDTFMTEQTDTNGKPLIAPAHTSSMQNRVISRYLANLARNEPIAVVIPGRTFRNEDVDARHEHTFYQVEGVYINKGVNVGNLIATLKSFLQSYFANDSLSVKTQPFYFPFTEPSLEFSLSCPFCNQQGCSICSFSGWIELLGCGMIHPNVLKEAGVDPKEYQGFAWGMGVERIIMMKYGIEDIRHFESGKLAFLRQFSTGGDS